MYGIMECKCCNCDETYHKHTFSIDYGTCKKFEEKGIYAPKIHAILVKLRCIIVTHFAENVAHR